jgi:hypothetical protein
MFEPLTYLQAKFAYRVWFAINIVLLAAAMILLLRPHYSGLSSPTAWFLAALALIYPPVAYNSLWA